MFFDESFNLVTERLRDKETNDPTNKMVLHTFIFHTFTCMCLFNQINCRLVYEDDMNIFRTLFNNPFFWLIFIFEMALQNYMIYMAPHFQLSQAILQVAELTFEQNIVAWTLGVSVLPIGALIKFIPLRFFQWFTDNINLEEDVDDNKVLQLKSMFDERMGTLQNEYMAHMQTRDGDELSVSDNDEEKEDAGQINGQDDDEESSDEDDYQEMSGPGKGPRSSNVNRYSMRLTQMVDKKKDKKKQKKR